jgi:hypothetical protein
VYIVKQMEYSCRRFVYKQGPLIFIHVNTFAPDSYKLDIKLFSHILSRIFLPPFVSKEAHLAHIFLWDDRYEPRVVAIHPTLDRVSCKMARKARILASCTAIAMAQSSGHASTNSTVFHKSKYSKYLRRFSKP